MKNGELENLDLIETNSEKKADEGHNLMKSTRINMVQKEVEMLREREKHLTAQVIAKDNVIASYS